MYFHVSSPRLPISVSFGVIGILTIAGSINNVDNDIPAPSCPAGITQPYMPGSESGYLFHMRSLATVSVWSVLSAWKTLRWIGCGFYIPAGMQ